MPSLGGTSETLCNPGQWTSLWDGPTFGFTYLWATQVVSVQWRRWSSGIPWYLEGTITLQVGKNTLPHGGPSAYMKLEVNPTALAIFRAT